MKAGQRPAATSAEKRKQAPAVGAADTAPEESALPAVGAANHGPTEPNILASIWRYRLVVAIFVGVFALVGVLVTSTRDTKYVAEAGVLLADPRPSASRSARDEVRYVADQVSILKSVPVSERASVLAANGTKGVLIPPGALRRNTSVRASGESNFISVLFEAAKPETSIAGANALVRAYRELVRSNIDAEEKATLQRLDREISRITRTLPKAPAKPDKSVLAVLNKLRAERARLQVDAALTTDVVSLFYPATRGKPQRVSLLSALVVSLLLGGLVGSGVAYVLNARRRDSGEPVRLQPLREPQEAVDESLRLAPTPAAEPPSAGGTPGRQWRSERSSPAGKAAVRRVKGP